MSTENQNAQLPSHDQAQATLFNRVFAEAFFNKLASLGHYPQGDREKTAMLEMAGLIAAGEAEEAAQSQHQIGPYEQIKLAMTAAINSDSPAVEMQRIQEANAKLQAKQAAWTLAHDPDIYNSVLATLVG